MRRYREKLEPCADVSGLAAGGGGERQAIIQSMIIYEFVNMMHLFSNSLKKNTLLT